MTPHDIRKLAEMYDEDTPRYTSNILRVLADVVEAAIAFDCTANNDHELDIALARLEAIKP